MYDDWSAVLTARARAVREYELHKEEAGPAARTRLFDAALLTWLTVVPPDRVGVARKLQLGVTLKPTAGGGFELDLSTPDAHKTAAIFGPSTTAVPAAACALLQAWLAEAGLTTTATAKPYVFVQRKDARRAAGRHAELAADGRRSVLVVVHEPVRGMQRGKDVVSIDHSFRVVVSDDGRDVDAVVSRDLVRVITRKLQVAGHTLRATSYTLQASSRKLQSATPSRSRDLAPVGNGRLVSPLGGRVEL